MKGPISEPLHYMEAMDSMDDEMVWMVGDEMKMMNVENVFLYTLHNTWCPSQYQPQYTSYHW